MEKFYKDLKDNLSDVCFDDVSRGIYSVDASIFEVKPLAIVKPTSIEELQLAMQIAFKHHVAITTRGAATGITGGCLGDGLIIDTSKHLNKIHEINIEEEYAICEPGVVQDRLNEALAPHGYRLGPDTSTGNRATIGGMVANNAAGARSLYYGRMIDHVENVELVLVGGKKISCDLTDGKIYQEVKALVDLYREDILKSFPKIPRHVSGYHLDVLLQSNPFNLSKIIVGSEGTLGIITLVKVKIVKKPQYAGLCVIHLNELFEGLDAIVDMLKFHPMALELIDDKILDAGHRSTVMKNRLSWLVGSPKALIVAEFSGNTSEEVSEKLKSFDEALNQKGIGYARTLLEDKRTIGDVWDLRKAGLGLLLSKRSYNRAIAFIEDLSISPEKLSAFMKEFCSYLKSVGKEAGIYGHVGSGCMHIRPYMDLRNHEELTLMQQIMCDVSDMVLKYAGAMSGEHGDGLIRSWLNEKMFGTKVYQAFIDLKKIFDPEMLMNPGKIVRGAAITENLRLSPDTQLVSIPTFLDFSKEGGFELAADLCNGNGQCRKAELVMCPSFQVTGDEQDTTRARATVLSEIIHGHLPLSELTGKSLYNVMDLCIECKGCKRECPSQVDMAKMKSEFLFQYQKKHGVFFRNRLFGHIHAINRWMSPMASFFNAMSKTSLLKFFLRLFGISSNRTLPKLAYERFSTWFNRQNHEESERKVALFNDTYTEFNHPEIGIAAYRVLKALGYHVELINGICCGRPLISKGMLPEAQYKANQAIEVFSKFFDENIPVVCLEPSCFSAFKDDYQGLHLNGNWEEVMGNCTTIEEFLHKQIVNGKLPLKLKASQKALIHGHCHQKALWGMQKTLDLLASAGIQAEEISSGCCGMAGSFGYEKEHDEISMKMGELHLLPAVRHADKDTLMIANGMSCRHQISHGSSRQAIHPIEAIAGQI